MLSNPVGSGGTEQSPPPPQGDPLAHLLDRGIVHGDAGEWLPCLPPASVDLIYTSPPYADARAYSPIAPDHYVEWFLSLAEDMLDVLKDTGSLALNIKNRVAKSGPLKGQRHPYVYELVLALQSMGYHWIETYIWAKPNAIPGRFGPRTKDAYEYVYHLSKGPRPWFDLDAVRVAYRTDADEIARRRRDKRGRRSTGAGFGRDRSKVFDKGGADPGNVVSVPQSYNQHYGPAGEHSAVMPEGLAEFFVKAMCPHGGVVLDPFAGSGTTVLVALRHDRQGGGIELHGEFVNHALARLARDSTQATLGAW